MRTRRLPIRESLLFGVAVTLVLGIGSMPAKSAADARNWRGTVVISASASRPVSLSVSDGPDSFSYNLRAVFKGQRSPRAQGPGWRGTLAWSFKGVVDGGTRDECSYSGVGKYPVDVVIYGAGEVGVTRLAVIFSPGLGVGVRPEEMGTVTQVCSGLTTEQLAFEVLPGVTTYTLTLPKATTSFSRAIRPKVRWIPSDFELATAGTGRMTFRLR